MKKFILTLTLALVCAACKKEATYYTVAFNPNGGTITHGTEKTIVKEGRRIEKFPNAGRDGYSLRGWFRDPGTDNEWDRYKDVVTADVTLYAGWGKLYKVVFHARGGTFPYLDGGETLTEERAEGEKLYIHQNVAKPGSVLEGWYRDPDLTRKWDFMTDVVTGETDLYARWSDGIEGLTAENYPLVDGATSTRSLNVLVACKLLGLKYYNGGINKTNENCIIPEGGYPVDGAFLGGRIKTSQSHGAMMNLIGGTRDIILRSTTASPDEREAAAKAGVTLIETPIALDAFVILKNRFNPVQSLTLEQVRRIYTKRLTNWAQVGGVDAAIKPFNRPRNSGSEEAFRELVMRGEEPAEFPEEQSVFSMIGLIWQMAAEPNSIGYIFQNYKDYIVDRRYDPVFAIEGAMPTPDALRAGTYPLTTRVYAIIRDDLPSSSTAYALYEWLQSDDAEMVLAEAGFVR